MGLTRGAIEAMAPDQSALKAASGLLKPGTWPLRARSGALIWGECQGSGANPYRVMADTEDPGSKCTCPSRKFPCKHALALMWMYVEDAAAFAPGDVPQWVSEWMGRRRKAAPERAGSGAAPRGDKSLDAARATAPTGPELTPAQVEARRKAAARRADDTARSVRAGLADLETWIADQLRTGLPGFVRDVPERCRRIAARLVDAKAGALAGRIDELPARILARPIEERIDAAIAALGKLVVLIRAWRAAPDDAELRREVVAAPTRGEVLDDPASLRVASTWEVLGERISTRRDGLVSQATWLIDLAAQAPRFAVLLDFFPASAGRRSTVFTPGEAFNAELVFYPAQRPLRAVIAAREPLAAPAARWADWPDADPMASFAAHLLAAPWSQEAPVLLPAGRIARDPAGQFWWQAVDAAGALRLAGEPSQLARGAALHATAGLWDGARFSPIAAHTDWGRLVFDA